MIIYLTLTSINIKKNLTQLRKEIRDAIYQNINIIDNNEKSILFNIYIVYLPFYNC